jgi:ATP-binding cassette, subfamily B, multidrug efflux pump
LSNNKTSLDSAIFFKVLSFTKPYKSLFYTSLIFTLSLAFITPLRPWLIQYSFDNFVSTPNQKKLFEYTIYILGVLFLECGLIFSSMYFTNKIGQNVIFDLRTQLFKQITGFRLSFFDKNPIGLLVTRTISDIQNIADVFSQGFLEILGDLLKIMIITTVMFYTDWQLSLISLSTIPVLVYSTYIFKNAIKKSFQDVRNAVAKLNSFVQEHITGISIIQTFNKENDQAQKFSELNKEHRQAHIRSNWAYSVFFPVVEVLSAISLGLLIWWGAKGALQEKYTLGIILSFTMYINMLFRPIRQLADRFNTLQMGIVCAERVFKLLETENAIKNEGKLLADSIQGNIVYQNVWFSYDSPSELNNENDFKEINYVLKGISFEVNKGQTIALVGTTGSGKTSIINLINRFYEKNKGGIFIDGIELDKFELTSLRSQIGMVHQDVFLFSDSIRNNITLGNKNISDAQIIEAAKEIGIWDFINKLPGKLDFDVKERGGSLSAGQKQLLSFIRAFVNHPKILILDEATSNIDSESEQLIQLATSKITKNQTSIIVAHRLSTVLNANKILVLQHGQIIESGSHLELISRESNYKHLYDLQFKNQEIIS